MNKRHEVERAGAGAGVGAIGGAVAGGGRGAAIGASIGAAAGAVSGFFMDRNLRLDKGTALEVRLDHPLQVPCAELLFIFLSSRTRLIKEVRRDSRLRLSR